MKQQINTNVAEVNPFEAFDKIEAERAAILAATVAKAAQRAKELTDKVVTAAAAAAYEQSKKEYQLEVAGAVGKLERKRNRANTRALHKGMGLTVPASNSDGPKVKSPLAGHRDGTEGYTMDVVIKSFMDANDGRVPTDEELHVLLPQFEVKRLRGHLGFLRRKGFIPTTEA